MKFILLFLFLVSLSVSEKNKLSQRIKKYDDYDNVKFFFCRWIKNN